MTDSNISKQDTPQTILPKHRKSLLVRAMPYALVTGAITAAGIAYEIHTSHLQSYLFNKIAEGKLATSKRLTGPGVPARGPDGMRRGYNRVGFIDERLRDNPIQKFTRDENTKTYDHRSLFGFDLNPVYDIKIQTGLRLTDANDRPLFYAPFPQLAYLKYNDIPKPLVDMLLIVEDHELRQVEDRPESWNYAVDWYGTAWALANDIGNSTGVNNILGLGSGRFGKSTTTVQAEKNIFTPTNVRKNREEKARQIVSASVRRYFENDYRISVLRYINIAGFPAYGKLGEQVGMPNAAQNIFGLDFQRFNDVLSKPASQLKPEDLPEAAKIYRAALALVMALPRPDDLRTRPQNIEERSNRFIKKMLEAGVLTEALAAEMRKTPLALADPKNVKVAQHAPNKVASIYRTELAEILNEQNLQTLDLLDMKVDTPIDFEATRRITDRFQRIINDPKYARELGLMKDRGLREESLKHLRLSYILFEDQGDHIVPRVIADTSPGQFNMVEKSLMSLGSMMKFPVMGEYFQMIEESYLEYCQDAIDGEFATHCRKSREDLDRVQVMPQDKLTQWVIDYLKNPDTVKTREAILEEACKRRYSASPHQKFRTNGGLAHYSNFDRKYDHLNPTLCEAFEKSMNLPFVRLMEDMKWHIIARKMKVPADIFTNTEHPARKELLRDFAAYDGLNHFNAIWSQQVRIKPGEAPDFLARKVRAQMKAGNISDERLSVIYMSIYPGASIDDLTAFVQSQCDTCSNRQRIEDLHAKYANNKSIQGVSTLADRAYTLRVHPLELWLARKRVQNPGVTYREAADASYDTRVESYRTWLIDSKVYSAQNVRIGDILEKKAFDLFHASLRAKGYPYDRMTPAINFPLSGEATPAFHAKYAMAVISKGIMKPDIRYEKITFGQNTPYEMPAYRPVIGPSKPIFSPEVAEVMHKMFQGVVENGTGRRLKGSTVLADGTVLVVGAKTGTSSGALRSGLGTASAQASLGRNAGLTGTYGDRFSSALLVHMPSAHAPNENFTSGVAVTLSAIIAQEDIRDILNHGYGVKRPEPVVRLPADQVPRAAHIPALPQQASGLSQVFRMADMPPLDYVLPDLNRPCRRGQDSQASCFQEKVTIR